MPELQHLDVNTSPKDVVAAVQKAGAVIIDNLMPAALADQIYQQTISFMTHSPVGEASFTGTHTTRTGALVARSAACRELITHPTLLETSETYLKQYCERVQLHLTQLIRIRSGQVKQPLHRDRQAWGDMIPKEIEPQLNTLWALTDFTEENGATQVVPGSHNWDYDRQAMPDEITQAVMSRGSVLVYSGSVIHGGGENRSGEDRIGINLTYALSWLRQEENQFLSCPPAIAKDLDPLLQELLGYTMGSTACGYYSDPVPAGEGREICPPEYALGRGPRPEREMGIVDQS
ncbi:MAG: ectoine hydroxylase-related dioxygenase (phytanoyl-CoA dioxygenase family) [Paraglaciecola psychrophila]|jgi:ectoine hydroxylase-related dioxygenase (phytanoyl-CoA dioxygenase family)